MFSSKRADRTLLPKTSATYRFFLSLFSLLGLLVFAGCSLPSETAPPPAGPQSHPVETSSPAGQPIDQRPIAADSGPVRREAPAPASPTPIPTDAPIPTLPAPPVSSPTLPALVNPIRNEMQAEADALGASFEYMSDEQTGIWQFESGSFSHPIAISAAAGRLYMVDAGRVLLFDLSQPAPPIVLLGPGDQVEEVPVLEPIDLAAEGDRLIVLDRAGDVYRYDAATSQWRLDRYDRPIGDSSGHYFVATALNGESRFLLETNYSYVLRYDEAGRNLWQLPESRAVDLSSAGESLYLLSADISSLQGRLTHLVAGRLQEAFEPTFSFEQPLEVVALPEELYVLDQGGERLTVLDPTDGTLVRLIQPPQDPPPDAMTVTRNGEMILAGADRLYFVGQPERRAVITAESQGELSFDFATLFAQRPWLSPIGGSGSPQRDLQMPGAPRHYRLGVHAGIDFYWQPGTEVRAIADGVVLRSDLGYETPSEEAFWAWREEIINLGSTPEHLLDRYRGRQVWLIHDDGLVSRYGHLRDVAPGIVEGARVTAGQPVGTVGNSGSPQSVDSDTADAHLHFELWMGEHFLGQYLRPLETRLLVNQLFQIH